MGQESWLVLPFSDKYQLCLVQYQDLPPLGFLALEMPGAS